jgi:DNA-binding NarL/FixJ family response regulator
MTISAGRTLDRVKSGDVLRSQDCREEVLTVILADQAVLMHMALRALFATDSRYSVVAAADTLFAAEQFIARMRPAMLICDTGIVGQAGGDLCRWTRRFSAVTRVVFLTSRDDARLAEAVIAAGAAGYLLKDTEPETITASLDRVRDGEAVVDARLGAPRAPSLPVAALPGSGFSRREGEVLVQLARGLDNKSIAGQLCIAEETVRSHMKAVFRKLGARDRAHAVALALGAAIPAASPAVSSVPPATAAAAAHAANRR